MIEDIIKLSKDAAEIEILKGKYIRSLKKYIGLYEEFAETGHPHEDNHEDYMEAIKELNDLGHPYTPKYDILQR